MKEPSAPESRRAEYEHRATFEALGIDKAVGERARTLFERDGRPDGKTEADYRAQAETDLRNRQPLIEARALDIQRPQGKPKDVAERQAAGEVASLYDRIAEYADDIKWARARTAERAGDTGAQALDVTSLTVAEQMIRQAQPAIAERAQRLWSEAGMPEGDGLRYWQRAEKEIIYAIEFVDDAVHRQTADLVRAHWERAGKPAGGSNSSGMKPSEPFAASVPENSTKNIRTPMGCRRASLKRRLTSTARINPSAMPNPRIFLSAGAGGTLRLPRG